MTTDAQSAPLDPKGPSWSHLLAVALEVAILAELVRQHSIVGVMLCVAYAWYSATWAAFAGLFRKGNE
jgi:hypothetical protein